MLWVSLLSDSPSNAPADERRQRSLNMGNGTQQGGNSRPALLRCFPLYAASGEPVPDTPRLIANVLVFSVPGPVGDGDPGSDEEENVELKEASAPAGPDVVE